MFNQHAIERGAPLSWHPAPTPEKEFSKTVLTKEQTFRDRDPGDKMFPKFAETVFSALRAPAAWLLLVY